MDYGKNGYISFGLSFTAMISEPIFGCERVRRNAHFGAKK